MKPGEPLLLVCNRFPPNAGIGGRRWAKFAKELARRGHPVHVIRSAGTPGTLNSLWTADVQHPNIIHHTMPPRFPAVMTQWPLTSFRDKLRYWFWQRVHPLLTKGNYYDLGFRSRKDLLRSATRLIREQGIRQVIVTGAPFTGHLQRTYGGPSSRYVVLPHAVDPDEMGVVPRVRQDAGFRMIYAGSLYGAEEADRYFEMLLQAFEALRESRPAAFATCRLDLYITGQGTGALAAKVAERGLADQVRFHPPLAPQAVFQQLSEADLVVNFIPSMNKHIMGTKFNEVFFLGCPVLHVGEPGLVSRTIEERRMGASIRVEELVVELPRIISGERKVEIDREADHSAYLLAHVTDRLINEVLA